MGVAHLPAVFVVIGDDFTQFLYLGLLGQAGRVGSSCKPEWARVSKLRTSAVSASITSRSRRELSANALVVMLSTRVTQPELYDARQERFIALFSTSPQPFPVQFGRQ